MSEALSPTTYPLKVAINSSTALLGYRINHRYLNALAATKDDSSKK
ncbi:hypothetical protein ACPD8N_05330 [Lacticaseibacillus chiayiensis]|nr:hypothetical protein [Lacticaseibacillus chiayiensis]QVI34218.1 hypothetical protein KG086_10530 [Lacticaseibacillus chiayiensis]